MANATTGSELVVPGQQPSAGERDPLVARLLRPVVTHWQFSLVVLAAVAMRIVVVLGYPPIFWFSDSYNYLYDAVTHVPDEVRPNGYPFFLDLLLPLHSDDAIGLLQAAMGVAVGVAIYALLRHRGLPWWGATLPALPVLFDAYELHLEHMITADPLFIFLVTIAVVILCWSDRPSILTMAVAGLLIGYATLVRSVGEPLLVGGPGRHAGPAGGLAPPPGPRGGGRRADRRSTWCGSTARTVKYALSESSGSFLYSRVSTFAQCSKMNVPALLAYLCDPTKLEYRPVAGEYVWADNELKPYRDDQHAAVPRVRLRHLGAVHARRQRPDRAVRQDRHRRPADGLRARGDRRHPAHLRLEPAARPARLLRERPELPVRQRPRR